MLFNEVQSSLHGNARGTINLKSKTKVVYRVSDLHWQTIEQSDSARQAS